MEENFKLFSLAFLTAQILMSISSQCFQQEQVVLKKEFIYAYDKT